MTLNTGRFTTRQDSGVVVFIIGTRINHLLRINQWLPVITAFPAMVKELEQTPSLGYMGGETFITGKTILSVQYWESSEALLKYAKGQQHLKAWRTFNQRIRKSDSVGMYHETHIIRPDESEALYINMPDFGLGKAKGVQAVTSQTHTARQRLKRDQTDDSDDVLVNE